MIRKVKNILLTLGVILEAGIALAFGFAAVPVSGTLCLFLWCLLAVLICELA